VVSIPIIKLAPQWYTGGGLGEGNKFNGNDFSFEAELANYDNSKVFYWGGKANDEWQYRDKYFAISPDRYIILAPFFPANYEPEDGDGNEILELFKWIIAAALTDVSEGSMAIKPEVLAEFTNEELTELTDLKEKTLNQFTEEERADLTDAERKDRSDKDLADFLAKKLAAKKLAELLAKNLVMPIFEDDALVALLAPVLATEGKELKELKELKAEDARNIISRKFREKMIAELTEGEKGIKEDKFPGEDLGELIEKALERLAKQELKNSTVTAMGAENIDPSQDIFRVRFNIGKFRPLIKADISNTGDSNMLSIAEHNVRLRSRYDDDPFSPVILTPVGVDDQGKATKILAESPYMANEYGLLFSNDPTLSYGRLPNRNVDGLLEFELKYYAFGASDSGGSPWIIKNGLFRAEDSVAAHNADGQITGKGEGAGSYIVVKFGKGWQNPTTTRVYPR
jgi:hypothetical protein